MLRMKASDACFECTTDQTVHPQQERNWKYLSRHTLVYVIRVHWCSESWGITTMSMCSFGGFHCLHFLQANASLECLFCGCAITHTLILRIFVGDGVTAFWHSLHLLPGRWLNELVCMFAWGITPIVEFDVQVLGVLIVAYCWISEAFSSKFVIIVACLVTRPWLTVLITKTNMHVVCWTNNLETCFGFLFCLLLSSHRPHMVFSLEVQLQLPCVG